MNPLLRHLFEVSYECITDSGIPLSVLHSNTTGTYTACFIPDNDPLETSRCGDSKYCKFRHQIFTFPIEILVAAVILIPPS